MSWNALAPPTPQLDALLDPPATEGGKEKRSIKSRLSDQFHRVRGRSPSPQPRGSGAFVREEPASPSKKLGVSSLLRRSIHRARSTSPRPSSRNSVAYDENAPEYFMPELPNWQLYDGSNTQLGRPYPESAPAPCAQPETQQAAPPEDCATEAVFEAYADPPAERAAQYVPSVQEAQGKPSVPDLDKALPSPRAEEDAGCAVFDGAAASARVASHEAKRASVVESVVEDTTAVANAATAEPLVPEQSVLNDADTTVIDHGTFAQRTHPYEPHVPSARPWKSYESDEEEEEGAGRLYRRRRAERVPDADAEAAAAAERAPSRAASHGSWEHKQERLLDAMQRAPEGAGLTDLMNRVVQPGRPQSWLRGIWPSDGSRSASQSTARSASQRTARTVSGGSQEGVIFQGTDASPSLYSTSSMDRFSDPGTRPASPPLSHTGSGGVPVERTSTRQSNGSSLQSDDEREAFERKRRSLLEARRILEREKRQGSADFQALEAPPPPVPTKDVHPPAAAVDGPPPPPEAAQFLEHEVSWHAQQDASYYAEHEASYYAEQEAAWHAQQQAEWYAYQEAQWYAQQEAAWHAQQEAAAHSMAVESMAQEKTLELEHAPPPPEQPAPGPAAASAGTRMLGKRKAPPTAAGRPLTMPAPLGAPRTSMPPPSTVPVHASPQPPQPPPASTAPPRPRVMPIPEPATPASTLDTVYDEQGRRLKPDGFGGLTAVFDDDHDSLHTGTPKSLSETPRAPQVASMHHDFTRKDDRPAVGVPRPETHFQHNLPGSASPAPHAAVLSPGLPARVSSPPQRAPSPQAAPRAPGLAPREAARGDPDAPFQVAAEVYTTPANMQPTGGRMTWTPEMAEAAARYIQSMTASASQHLMPDAVPVRPATELAVPKGMAPSRSVVEQLQARGVDLVLDAGSGVEPKELPVQQALQEMMVRFYLYERHAVPILKELDKRLVALEHWSLLDRDLESRQPAWNEEAVARITSEVRREMRGLMAGIRELHECRLQLRALTPDAAPSAPKRKRPTSLSGPEKRIASETNSVRTASSASHASSSPTQATPRPDAQPVSLPPPPPSPLASLAGLGPRPYTPRPMQEAQCVQSSQEAEAPHPPAERPSPEAKTPSETTENKPPGTAPLAAPLAERGAPEPPAERDATPPSVPAQEAAAEPPAADASPAATPVARAAPLRDPVPVKPVYADRAAESGLLQALLRANERAHTPPPPSPQPQACRAAPPASGSPPPAPAPPAPPAPSAPASVPAPTDAPSEADTTTAAAAAADAPSPEPSRPMRAPMASVGNVPSAASTGASSALRARAQRYLKHTDRASDGKTPAPAPTPENATEPASENVAPTKPTYQPSALSESLRRRMATFDPSA